MTPYYTDDWLTIYSGDSREVLATLPADSVDCVVTSPPYWGLRDYGTATWVGGDEACDHRVWGHAPDKPTPGGRGGSMPKQEVVQKERCGKCGATRVDSQLGLERTPEEYVANMVAVFREVRRVLKPSGTCWLNLGSSYISQDGYPLKPTDAAWLAGLIDGEGCIQVHRQKRPAQANSVDSFQIDLSVGMMTPEAVHRAYEITGLGSCGQQNRGVWDWSVRGQQTATLLRALYPFLVTKRRQAAYAVMLAKDLAEQRFGRGRPATEESMEYRQAIKAAISDLNQRQEPTLPMVEPEPLALGVKAKDDALIPEQMAIALRQDGWYVRSTIVWAKSNPMPESVTDRPTKSHEMVFLLTKSARYYFDADAVREPHTDPTVHRDKGTRGTQGYAVASGGPNARPQRDSNGGLGKHEGGRNIRSVWTIATRPYPGAHFAVFPPELPERCIKAGSSEKGVCPECGAPWERILQREGGERYATGKSATKNGAGLATAFSGYTDGSSSPTFTTLGWRPTCDHGAEPIASVTLDPFAGSGTTGMVAQKLGRRAILIDLNPDYLKQQLARNAQTPLGLDAA